MEIVYHLPLQESSAHKHETINIYYSENKFLNKQERNLYMHLLVRTVKRVEIQIQIK